MKLYGLLLVLVTVVLFTSCGSPFASVVVAPASAQVIASPADLPSSLSNSKISWIYMVDLKSGNRISFPPDFDTSWDNLSHNGLFFSYVSKPILATEGLPTIGDTTIKILDLQTDVSRVLVSQRQSFPDAVSFAAPTFTPDGKNVVFVVEWEHTTDLVKVDVESGEMHRLNVDVVLTNFGHPDVSSLGQIVVICKGPASDGTSELCLLDENGKFIRYLTLEKYSWPGNELFTPDGQYVVYESRYVMYKVKVADGGRKQIAPCGSPLLVTNENVIAWCFVSQKPDCYSLFLSSLDGSDFRRIGYIDQVCKKE